MPDVQTTFPQLQIRLFKQFIGKTIGISFEINEIISALPTLEIYVLNPIDRQR